MFLNTEKERKHWVICLILKYWIDFKLKFLKILSLSSLEGDVESEDDFEEAINGKFDAESDEDEDGQKMENGAQAAVKKYNKK